MFPQVLKTLRERRGLSQSALAERAGFDHSYVHRLEAGTRSITRESAMSLAFALRLNKTCCKHFLLAAGFVPESMGRQVKSAHYLLTHVPHA